MISGTGYNVVIGFSDKENALATAIHIRKEHGFAVTILKVEEVE